MQPGEGMGEEVWSGGGGDSGPRGTSGLGSWVSLRGFLAERDEEFRTGIGLWPRPTGAGVEF